MGTMCRMCFGENTGFSILRCLRWWSPARRGVRMQCGAMVTSILTPGCEKAFAKEKLVAPNEGRVFSIPVSWVQDEHT